MNTEITSDLPYIQIKHPPMKLLIDTGCSQSMIRPSIAQNYFPEKIFTSPSKIRTGIGEKLVQFKANIPAPPELNSNEIITFTLFDFHPYFDGILGLSEIRKLNLLIDFKNHRLKNDVTLIPILYPNSQNKSFTISVNSHEVIATRIPVTTYEGDIIIPECHVQNLYFPETLTTAEQGFAKTEIFNYSDENVTINLNEPLKVIPFPDSRKDSFEFFHIEEFLPRKQLEKTADISKLIRVNHLNEEERESITKLCREFSDIFYKDGEKLSFTNETKHDIKTTDEIPVHTKSYRYPFVHKEEVRRQINKMLDDGIIRPSQSPWSSPIWIVPKKLDSSNKPKWRLVVDFRKINEKTITDRYPLPNINDILDKLGRS